ncbi:uncharacterized protein LOC134710548 [Mytilus trossulus]|uniref:uncharacterized protein LOC134710548 n=1 Tax=Mytilus trossulus TaxID=6551 RepID=UPI0030047BD2
MPKVVLNHTFKLNFPKINRLVSLNDDIYVMFNRNSRRFVFFTISGSKFVTTNDFIDESVNSGYANISDITNYKEDILLSDDKFKIRRLRRNGQFEELSPSITDDNLSFEGIHTTKKKEIILGFTNRRDCSAGFFELTHMTFAPPKMIYTYNKSIMRRVEGNSKEFITLPKKITTNINGYVCVLDKPRYPKKPRVVVIGKWGQPKWIYSGHPDINSENDFSPNDIITTSLDLVLVAEKKTNAIHVLSKDGQFICNCIADTNITEPVSICLNKEGQLVIGCTDSGKTELHMTNFIE